MSRFALIVAALMLLAVRAAVADFPPPGAHSTHTKYWPLAHLHVVNYSPYEFATPVQSMIADRRGDGIWFTSGSTVERIHRDGTMQLIRISNENRLWGAYSLTYDGNGNVRFSLGQSGKLGSIDPSGRLRVETLVPRKDFPDIRDIAFAEDGTLWFVDRGRESIGRRDRYGETKEVRVPNLVPGAPFAWPEHLALCDGQAYLSVNMFGTRSLFRVSPDLSTFSPVSIGGTTLAKRRLRQAESAMDARGGRSTTDEDRHDRSRRTHANVGPRHRRGGHCARS